MSGFKAFREGYKYFQLIGQLGLSLIMPTLLCLLLCWWLTDRFHVGMWVYVPGFIFGLGGSFTTGYNFYRSLERKEQKKEKKNRVFYNRHS